MLQHGMSHGCACVKLSAKGGALSPFWGAVDLPEDVSRESGVSQR